MSDKRAIEAFVENLADGLYTKDEKQTIRCSADNPDVQAVYREFFGAPLGPLAHELLHTSYGRSGNC